MSSIQNEINQLFGNLSQLATVGTYFTKHSPTVKKKEEIRSLKKDIKLSNKAEEMLAQRELEANEDVNNPHATEIASEIGDTRVDLYQKQLADRRRLLQLEPSAENVSGIEYDIEKIQRRKDLDAAGRRNAMDAAGREGHPVILSGNDMYAAGREGHPVIPSGNRITSYELQRRIDNMRMFDRMKERVKLPRSLDERIKKTYTENSEED